MNKQFSLQHSQLANILSKLDEIARLDADQAQTMPGAFYTNPELLEIEKENVFHQQWACLGHAGEIPDTGDYFTTELVGEQLLVVRGDDNCIRVLSNVCRHRGNMLAQGAGNRNTFVCPYHAWSYQTDGALKRAPLMDKVAGFNPGQCRLPEFSSEIWNGFIFVNLDGKAKDLRPQLKELDKMVHNYHPEQRHFSFVEEDVWQTNWKNLAENFIEGYHLSVTHKDTLHPITPTRLCKKEKFDPAFTVYRAYYSPDFPPRGPFHEDMTEDEKHNSVMGCIFPNFLFGIASNFALFVCIRPVDADSVALRWFVTGPYEDTAHKAVKEYIDLCRAFNAEDREKLETLQQAQKSRYYSSGQLAPADYEGTIWDFLNYMASRLTGPVNVKPAERTHGADA